MKLLEKMLLKTLIAFLLAVCVVPQGLALSFDEARHLLARTGFGSPSPSEIDKILPLKYETAVDAILDGVLTEAITPVPKFLNLPIDHPKLKGMGVKERKAHNSRGKKDRKAIRYWWINEMLTTPSPFTEHMVLFWHNHFVSEIAKVQYAKWSHDQNAIFRKYAIGDFKKMLLEVSMGPAMMKYLDTSKNKKNKPNENFAREILELFTLGEGHIYTEEDIRESARAYTGWLIDWSVAEFGWKLWAHDQGVKTFLGQEGNFTGQDAIDIILQQPRVSEYLVEKLWREFISEELNQFEIKRLAKIVRDNRYNLKPMIKALLMSDSFRDPKNRGILIKSPVELTIGTLRLLGLKPPEIKQVHLHQKRSGQDIFQPPDVKGWRAGKAWISSTTTLSRSNFLKIAAQGFMKYRKNNDTSTMNMRRPAFGITNPMPLQKREKTQPGYLKNLILAVEPVMRKKFTGKKRKIIRNLLLDPAYQVK
ncbi:MAG: DUF1800 domain-containing protein [Pseudomonadota bacterium]|nr:DUF1800 domain-containing protein [Pseudomonadota bacterium]